MKKFEKSAFRMAKLLFLFLFVFLVFQAITYKKQDVLIFDLSATSVFDNNEFKEKDKRYTPQSAVSYYSFVRYGEEIKYLLLTCNNEVYNYYKKGFDKEKLKNLVFVFVSGKEFEYKNYEMVQVSAQNEKVEQFISDVEKAGILTPHSQMQKVRFGGFDLGDMIVEGVKKDDDRKSLFIFEHQQDSFVPMSVNWSGFGLNYFGDKGEKEKKILSDFLTGKLKASEVFDVQKMAKFLSVVEQHKAYSWLGWQKFRLIYNQQTSRFEPFVQRGVPHFFDAYKNIGKNAETSIYEMPIISLILKDEKMKKAFLSLKTGEM
jgi:hypothetical protein